MKLIFKNVTIELDYEEFQKLFPIKDKDKKHKESGRKSKITKEEIALIQKISMNYPKRSSISIQKEMSKFFNKDITLNTVKCWRKKVKGNG